MCSTSFSAPSFTQVTFGFGFDRPDATQNNCRFVPSLTVWLLLTLLVNKAGTKKNNTHNVNWI